LGGLIVQTSGRADLRQLAGSSVCGSGLLDGATTFSTLICGWSRTTIVYST